MTFKKGNKLQETHGLAAKSAKQEVNKVKRVLKEFIVKQKVDQKFLDEIHDLDLIDVHIMWRDMVAMMAKRSYKWYSKKKYFIHKKTGVKLLARLNKDIHEMTHGTRNLNLNVDVSFDELLDKWRTRRETEIKNKKVIITEKEEEKGDVS
ncbi:MAG: hypothetical protein ACTSPI_13570 [Candidatus Heimdallarchaeaceae archaeon]